MSPPFRARPPPETAVLTPLQKCLIQRCHTLYDGWQHTLKSSSRQPFSLLRPRRRSVGGLHALAHYSPDSTLDEFFFCAVGRVALEALRRLGPFSRRRPDWREFLLSLKADGEWEDVSAPLPLRSSIYPSVVYHPEIKDIGKGSFGTVYNYKADRPPREGGARHPEWFAVKLAKLTTKPSPRFPNSEPWSEIDVLRRLEEPAVVKRLMQPATHGAAGARGNAVLSSHLLHPLRRAAAGTDTQLAVVAMEPAGGSFFGRDRATQMRGALDWRDAAEATRAAFEDLSRYYEAARLLQSDIKLGNFLWELRSAAAPEEAEEAPAGEERAPPIRRSDPERAQDVPTPPPTGPRWPTDKGSRPLPPPSPVPQRGAAAVGSAAGQPHRQEFHVFACDFGGFVKEGSPAPSCTYASPAGPRFPEHTDWALPAFGLGWLAVLLVKPRAGSDERRVKALRDTELSTSFHRHKPVVARSVAGRAEAAAQRAEEAITAALEWGELRSLLFGDEPAADGAAFVAFVESLMGFDRAAAKFSLEKQPRDLAAVRAIFRAFAATASAADGAAAAASSIPEARVDPDAAAEEEAPATAEAKGHDTTEEGAAAAASEGPMRKRRWAEK